jgi:hypothetical protein
LTIFLVRKHVITNGHRRKDYQRDSNHLFD